MRHISMLAGLVVRYLVVALLAVVSPCTLAQVKNDKQIAPEIAAILNSQLSTARGIASNLNKFVIDVKKAGQIADTGNESICRKFWQQFVEGQLQVPKSALMSATTRLKTEALAKVVRETTAGYLEATRVHRRFGPETLRALTPYAGPKRDFDENFALAKQAFDRRWNPRLGPTGRFNANGYHILFSDLLLPNGQPSLLAFSIDLVQGQDRSSASTDSSTKFLEKFKWDFFHSDGSSSGNSLLSWDFANETTTNEEDKLTAYTLFDYAGIVEYPIGKDHTGRPVVWALRGKTDAPLFAVGNDYYAHELRTYLLINRERFGYDPMHSCRILFN